MGGLGAGAPCRPSNTFLPFCITRSPPRSMALPRFGPSIFTSLVSFTAFKRPWSSVPWSLRKSLRAPGFVLRVCCSFPLYTRSQVVRPHVARLCQALPTLCCYVDFFVARNTGSSFGETACAFKRVSVNLRALARLWSPC